MGISFNLVNSADTAVTKNSFSPIDEKKLENYEDFFNFGSALDEDLKHKITESFDSEADYILQNELSALFENKSSFETKDFMTSIEDMGYEIEDDSYKMDFDNGTILTIRNSSTGASFSITDADNDGKIQAEELFMAQILDKIQNEQEEKNTDEQEDSELELEKNYEIIDALIEEQVMKDSEKITKEAGESSNKTSVTPTEYYETLRQRKKEYQEAGYDPKEALEKAKKDVENKLVISKTSR